MACLAADLLIRQATRQAYTELMVYHAGSAYGTTLESITASNSLHLLPVPLHSRLKGPW